MKRKICNKHLYTIKLINQATKNYKFMHYISNIKMVFIFITATRAMCNVLNCFHGQLKHLKVVFLELMPSKLLPE